MRANIAAAELTRPGRSSLRAELVSRDSGMAGIAIAIVLTPIGTLMKKIQPQCTCWLINPPISGPKASAIAPIAVQTPIAVVRSLTLSKVARMIASVVGTRSAAPMPCTSRAPISSVPLPASPAASDEIVKTDKPIMNSLRRP